MVVALRAALIAIAALLFGVASGATLLACNGDNQGLAVVDEDGGADGTFFDVAAPDTGIHDAGHLDATADADADADADVGADVVSDTGADTALEAEASTVSVVILGPSGPLTAQNERDYFAVVTGAASSAVTWSVVEAQGGTIGATGQYTAPATPGTYTVKATSQADSTASATLSVDVVAVPVATLTAPSFVTAGTTGLVASVPAQPGAIYAWTVAGGTLTAGATASAITFTAGAPGTLSLTCVVTNAAGTTATGTAAVVVTSAPVVAITAPSFATAGATGLVASVAPQAGATYAWTITGGAQTAGAGTPSLTFTAAAVGTVTLGCTVTVAGTPVSGTATVTVVAPAVADITAPASAASGATGLTASVAAQPGTTIVWSIAGGTITAGQGTSGITFTAGSVGSLTLTCTVQNAAGATASGTATVPIVSPPVTTTISAPSEATTGTTGLSASVPPQVGVAYTWTLSGGTITSQTDGATVVFTAGGVGTAVLGVSLTNAAGSVSTSTLIAIVSAPVVAITAPAVAASGATGLTASVTAQAGDTYAWTVTGGTITAGQGTSGITFSAGAAGMLTIGCTVTNPASTSTAGSATVTVEDPPTTPTISAPGQATAGTANLAASVAAQAAVTYAWTITGGTLTSPANGSSIVFTAGAAGTPVALGCTVTNAVGSASASASVAVVATPVVSITAPASAITGTTGLVASVPSQAGVTYAWTLAGGTITAGQGTDQITFAAGAVGALTLGCTVTNAAMTQTTGTAAVDVVAATTSLTVSITGNPPDATVSVSGPDDFVTTLNATQTLSGLAPGVYDVTAGSVVFSGLTYTPLVTGSPDTLAAGDSSSVGVSYTASDTPPTLGAIADQVVFTNGSTVVPFTIGDAEDGPSSLQVAASTNPTGLVTTSLGGTGANRTITLTAGAASGATQVTVTVTDSQRVQPSATFNVVVSSSIVTTANDSGVGSLRSVVASVAAGVTITFAPALSGQTITLLSAISLTQDVTIQGPGAGLLTLSGGGATQIFGISGGNVTLSGLTLDSGVIAGGEGGAIFGAGNSLTITDCTVSGSSSAFGAILGAGGPVVLSGSTFSGNSGTTAGGGSGTGGAVFSFGPVTATNCTFTGNAAVQGGAIYGNATTTVTGCTFASNSASASGGALYNSGGDLRVTNSTFAGNSATTSGGAISADSATLASTTFSANSPGVETRGGTFSVGTSIVDALASGTFTSLGYNLVGSTSGATFTAATGDLVGTPPGLGPLASNGGPTQTMALQAASPAVGAVPVGSCVDASGAPLPVDQRGSPRPSPSHPTACDIGAFERQPTD